MLEEPFLISAVTLRELEDIKVSRNKNDDVKFRARRILHILDEHPDIYAMADITTATYNALAERKMPDTPDNLICVSAAYIKSTSHPDLEFVTNDLACKMIAKNVFGLPVSSVETVSDDYSGYRDIVFSDEEMAYLYEHPDENNSSLLENEYLIVRNESGKVADILVWRNGSHQSLRIPKVKSNHLGTIKPYQGDVYQRMVMDSLSNNQITMIKGPAGTGKSLLALGYLMSLLERGEIERIIVFCNTVATINSAKIGYLPGNRDEKLLDSSIGNMLSAKLGDSFGLERLVMQEKITLLPMSDIRGFDTSNMKAGIYITEAQNMDISLMKLALQRIGNDSICIVEGDYNTQVDLLQYAGRNNGMRRMSEVFRGNDIYGEIELKNIYRSKIALIAEEM